MVGDGAGAGEGAGAGGGGNRAVREWIGGGLKPLGEMIEREDETYEGERAEVIREVFVSHPHPRVLVSLQTCSR